MNVTLFPPFFMFVSMSYSSHWKKKSSVTREPFKIYLNFFFAYWSTEKILQLAGLNFSNVNTKVWVIFKNMSEITSSSQMTGTGSKLSKLVILFSTWTCFCKHVSMQPGMSPLCVTWALSGHSSNVKFVKGDIPTYLNDCITSFVPA